MEIYKFGEWRSDRSAEPLALQSLSALSDPTDHT